MKELFKSINKKMSDAPSWLTDESIDTGIINIILNNNSNFNYN